MISRPKIQNKHLNRPPWMAKHLSSNSHLFMPAHFPTVVFLLFGMFGSSSATVAPLPIDLPDGFIAETAAEPPLVTHPIMAMLGDRGKHFVGDAAGVKPQQGRPGKGTAPFRHRGHLCPHSAAANAHALMVHGFEQHER
jgi:hypothetical protein